MRQKDRIVVLLKFRNQGAKVLVTSRGLNPLRASV